ncbi:hypothetical protein C0991_006869 [Blastosporella zonata]|nr:hypothetical protein C0991_006869 [Blastosporella zonata]
MAPPPIVVGRVIVDPDHADVARSLLSVENALAEMGPVHDQAKGKGPATDTDEVYAREVQEEFLRDALRTMEDYRYARNLAARNDSYPASIIVPTVSMDYLRTLLILTPIDPEPSDTQKATATSEYVLNGVVISIYLTLESQVDDIHLVFDDDDDPPNTGYLDLRESAAVAAEHRQASLDIAINAGLPGPSGHACSRTMEPVSEEIEEMYTPFDYSRTASPSGFSRSSTDPGEPDYIGRLDELSNSTAVGHKEGTAEGDRDHGYHALEDNEAAMDNRHEQDHLPS